MTVMTNESAFIEGSRPTGLRPAGRAAPGDDVSITCYDNVPPSLGPELEQLYHHLNSSLCHYAVARRARDACAYVARRGDQPVAIFLFERGHRHVDVFNEMMQVAPGEIERFAGFIFDRFPAVARISFSKIGTDVAPLSRPRQQYGHTEDIVVTLPGTVDAYLSSLSAKTRYNLRHQMKALTADFPGFAFAAFENAAIAEHHVSALIDLKKANMADKRVKFGISAEERAWITERAKTNGLLVVALLDGKVCGGSLSFCLGEHYFAHVNGYDPRFAKYSVGMLCCYAAMRETIQRGAKEAHLSWGRNQYKFKLLGVAREMANLDIYRSRMAYCRHVGRVLGIALREGAARQKAQLLEYEQRSAFAGRLVKFMRRLKRSSFRPSD
jgi:hypothetical protein